MRPTDPTSGFDAAHISRTTGAAPRRFVLYEGQSLFRAVTGFCARHRLPDRVNTVETLLDVLSSHLRGQTGAR
jgi:hypothetical protein